MDSQHRHELQQNDLRKLATQAVPFVEQYAWHMVAAAVAAIAVFFGLAMWFSESSASTSKGWAQFDQVLHEANPTAGDFDAVAEKHPGSSVAAWARLKEADDYMKSGLREAFTNAEVSQSELKKAVEAYQKLAAGGPGVLPEIRERALFGLARSQEATSDGKTDEAVATYQRLLKDFPETCFQAIASERIKELETAPAQEFYAWFHTLKPKPQEPVVNPFRKRLGETDDATDAAAPGEKSSGDDVKTEETPAAEKPAEEAQPESDKPATEPAAEEKPAEDAKKSDSP